LVAEVGRYKACYCRVFSMLLNIAVRDGVIDLCSCLFFYSKSERKSTAEGIKCLKAFINNRVSEVLHNACFGVI